MGEWLKLPPFVITAWRGVSDQIYSLTLQRPEETRIPNEQKNGRAPDPAGNWWAREKKNFVRVGSRTTIPRTSRTSPNDYNDWAIRFHDNYVLTMQIWIIFFKFVLDYSSNEHFSEIWDPSGAHRTYKIRADWWIWSLSYILVPRRVRKITKSEY
jgi:hypothetical protein